MRRTLVISVRLHDGRYHGNPEWPPSPARLFQALLAGAARGDALDAAHRTTLAFIELLDAPVIAAPSQRRGQGVSNYMPNNDLDAALPTTLKAGGTLAEAVAGIRAEKQIRPFLFDAEVPFHYLYDLTDDAPDEAAFAELARGLYQLGRGVDMGFARAAIVSAQGADELLADYPGAVHRPSGTGGTRLPVPTKGTLASLEARHAAFRARLQRGAGGIVFAQPPKATTRQVLYDAPALRLLFDLDGAVIEPTRVVALTAAIRDAVAGRLAGIPDANPALVERVVLGRTASDADKAARLRILPLPSIGHEHADRGIRRVLVEVPAGCALPRDHVSWAFAGLSVPGFDAILTPADDHGMIRHYGARDTARLWRSVTPLALTLRERAPARGKTGSMRQSEEAAARMAFLQALRQADIRPRVQSVRVQREPFAAKDRRAEAFAHGARFPSARLWHAEVTLEAPVSGPVALGDGRYLGLGLMAPSREAEPGTDGVFAFRIADGLAPGADLLQVTEAARRAVMARVSALPDRGDRTLPLYVSGHAADGAKAGDGEHQHIALAAHRDRLLIFAPHVLMHRAETTAEVAHRKMLARALNDFTDLRAGPAGRLALVAESGLADDPLLRPARHWQAVNDYIPTRHAKRLAPADAVANDIARELRVLGLPEAEIRMVHVHEGPRGGLSARAELTFKVAVSGPILIGRTRHRGGGLFVGVE